MLSHNQGCWCNKVVSYIRQTHAAHEEREHARPLQGDNSALSEWYVWFIDHILAGSRCLFLDSLVMLFLYSSGVRRISTAACS